MGVSFSPAAAAPMRWACIYGGYDMLASAGQCFRANAGVSSKAGIMAAVERGMKCNCVLFCAVVPPSSLCTFYLLQACVAVVPFVPCIRWNPTTNSLSLYSNMSKYNFKVVFSRCTWHHNIENIDHAGLLYNHTMPYSLLWCLTNYCWNQHGMPLQMSRVEDSDDWYLPMQSSFCLNQSFLTLSCFLHVHLSMKLSSKKLLWIKCILHRFPYSQLSVHWI